ncbi:MAG: peptidyl-prolyl cis-trans isomerase [Deltaproteobacteria bacterium]|nr:peptidyl-prolyl cis-trans isomerase [Deltaproteobacteria bacterium]
MKRRYIFFTILAVACFLMGLYSWRFLNMGRRYADEIQTPIDSMLEENVLMEVGDERIYTTDVDLEYKIYTHELGNHETLTAIPEVKEEKGLESLRARILDAIIERKILYNFVKSDKTFKHKDISRLNACNEAWRKVLEVLPHLDKEEQARLNTRLCEKSLIEQYCHEKLFKDIKATEADLRHYYEEHKEEFNRPPLVQIRQLVLANERKARIIRGQVNKSNFSRLAQENSIAPEAEKGGVVGPYRSGVLPRVFDVAFSMSVGQISDILKSTYGFHIFILDKKENARTLSFEEAREKVFSTLVKEKQDKVYRNWVELAIHSVGVRTLR